MLRRLPALSRRHRACHAPAAPGRRRLRARARAPARFAVHGRALARLARPARGALAGGRMTAPLTVAWHVPVRHRDRDRMPASVWIRCLQLLPYLERHGVRSVINDTRTAADVAVFVRSQDAGALAAARAAKANGTRVVVDLCVNYLDETGLMPGGYGVLARHVDECRAMLAASDAVTAASAFIADRARQAGARAEYLPDSVDAA